MGRTTRDQRAHVPSLPTSAHRKRFLPLLLGLLQGWKSLKIWLDRVWAIHWATFYYGAVTENVLVTPAFSAYSLDLTATDPGGRSVDGTACRSLFAHSITAYQRGPGYCTSFLTIKELIPQLAFVMQVYTSRKSLTSSVLLLMIDRGRWKIYYVCLLIRYMIQIQEEKALKFKWSNLKKILTNQNIRVSRYEAFTKVKINKLSKYRMGTMWCGTTNIKNVFKSPLPSPSSVQQHPYGSFLSAFGLLISNLSF